MRKIFGILIALALVLSFSLVAVPAGADEPHQNTVESSTMIFEGDLTDEGGGVYTGTIDMTEGEYYVVDGPGEGVSTGGGFDVYAEEGGCAYCLNYYGTGAWNCDGTDTYIVGYYTGTNHDAYPLPGGPWGSWYNPDCADWNQYSLELTADHWYLRYTATGESPMSGVMYWYGDGTGYAAETDKGTLDSNDDGVVDGVYDLGGPAMWDWNAGAQVERIPLEYPGFAVDVTPGSYTVTLTPAAGPVLNVDTSVTYGTIQLAVDDAGAGHTLEVDAGTYNPFTVIGKTGLTIQSGSVVTVQGLQVVTTNYGDRDAVVFVSDSIDIVLDDLIIGPNTGKTQEKDYGVVYENSSGMIIDCTVSPDTSGDLKSTAIAIWDASDVIIDPCTIEEFGRIGVFIYNGCTVDILGGSIEGQVYSGEGQVCYGVEVEALTDPSTACDVAIDGVEIYNCDNTFVTGPTWVSGGVLINGWLESQPQADSTVIIENCDIHDNEIGIIATKSPSSSAHFNNIYGNRDYGVESGAAHDASTAVFDALYNWWGDETGPSHDLNLGGQGDAVSDNVNFSPWLYKTQEQFVSGAPCYAGSVVLENKATEVEPDTYAGGWNSFSTPITLDDSANTVSELLALTAGSGLFIERAQRFDLASQAWVPVIMGNVVIGADYQIKPGEGLFIQVSSEGSIPILIKTTPTSPPMSSLVAGWNLIGMSSLEAETVTTALSGVSYSVVLSPKPPNDVAWSVPPAGAGDKELLLGEAYWVAMGGPGILFGFTTTPVSDDMTWDLNQ